MMTTVPSMAPGQRSLPAELRVNRSRAGTGVMDRLMAGMHGLGDDDSDDDDDSSGFTDTSDIVTPVGYTTPIAESTADSFPVYYTPTAAEVAQANAPLSTTTTYLPATSTTSAVPNVAQLISGLNQTLAISQGGSIGANGAISGSSAASLLAAQATASTSMLSSLLPLLLIGGGIFLVISMAGKK